MKEDIPVRLQLLFETSLEGLCAAVEEDGTSGLVIEVLDDSDKVGADVILLHGCPQSCMPKPVEVLLEVCDCLKLLSIYFDLFVDCC